MAPQIAETATGLISVERDDGTFTGIDTRIPANSFSLRKLAGRKRQYGMVIADGTITPWKPVGFTEFQGSVYVLGQPFQGRFLDDILTDEAADRMDAVRRIAVVFAALQEASVPIQPIHTRSIILLDNGSALVLPADIMEAVREHQDYAERLRSMERFNHPDRTPEQNIPFFVATASYFVLTGTFPFEADDQSELHNRMRTSQPVPARYRDVSIKTQISDTIQTALTAEAGEEDSSQWGARIQEWIRTGVTEEVTAEERLKREQEAGTELEKLDKAFRRKDSVRRHWRTTAIVAVLVLLIGSIPGSILYNALQPRVTAGFPPEMVVETFYTSINTLDHITMEDCVVDKAGGSLVREVTNLYVMDRQRMSVEMESGFVDAQLWRDAGMPPLANLKAPYGVANLVITPAGATETEVRFTVTYERWLPDYPEADVPRSTLGYVGFTNSDQLSLRKDKEDWVIFQIDSQRLEALDVGALRRALE